MTRPAARSAGEHVPADRRRVEPAPCPVARRPTAAAGRADRPPAGDHPGGDSDRAGVRRPAGTRDPWRAHRVRRARSLFRRSKRRLGDPVARRRRPGDRGPGSDRRAPRRDRRPRPARAPSDEGRPNGGRRMAHRTPGARASWRRRRPEIGVRHGARPAMRTRTGPAGSPVAARRQSAARRADSGRTQVDRHSSSSFPSVATSPTKGVRGRCVSIVSAQLQAVASSVRRARSNPKSPSLRTFHAPGA